ncbi:MAG: hypothetical protein JNK85_08955 [Verrucomicrobiales bacterium]|nr:hypothetical protein [Verrucomicrobiales bacterium]
MGFFDRWLGTNSSPEAADKVARQRLVEMVLGALRDPSGRIRVEDAISVAATIVAERCIDAAGDYSMRDHTFAPGSRVFSDRVNQLICGDDAAATVETLPASTVLGHLRRRLDPGTYRNADFPAMRLVIQSFAAGTGDANDWGKVPLSVPTEHLPWILPLQAGYETRAQVDGILRPMRDDPPRCLRIATEALAEILMMVATSIDRRHALALAVETLHGMSKTAPMTEKAMSEAQRGARR